MSDSRFGHDDPRETRRSHGDSVLVAEGDGTPHPLAGRPDRSDVFDGQPNVELLSGSRMPALGLGTWQLTGDDCRSIVAEAIELGVRHIDTAQSYGNEADVGASIASSGVDRDDLFITTKLANDHHEPASLVASVEASVERLRTDHVDLLLVHWPVDFDRMGATLSTLAQVQASGLARHIGVSNFTVDQLEQIADLAPLEVLQCECHPFLQQRELRTWCVSHGWAFTAYSPLARGDVNDDDALRDIARKHSVSPAAVTLAWLLAQPQVTAVPKTSDSEHLHDNWAARSVELDQRDLDRIAARDVGRRLVQPDFAPW